MKNKIVCLSMLLVAMLLTGIVTATASAQPESSVGAISNYQNISWETVKQLESGTSNGQVYELFFLKNKNQV